jgi:hypothetical protein
VLGLGAGNEDGRSHYQIHAPKFLVARDVLRGNAAGALGECGFVTAGFVGGEFAFGMRVKVRAVAA